MKKTTFLLGLTVAMLVGCAAHDRMPPAPIKTCSGSNGKDVKIKYGDGYIEVDWKKQVKRDEKIVFKLDPENNPSSGTDYEHLTISIIGKSTDDSWLTRDMAESDSAEQKIICVDGQAVGLYEYTVYVPGVGYIDPYVDVVEN